MTRGGMGGEGGSGPRDTGGVLDPGAGFVGMIALQNS